MAKTYTLHPIKLAHGALKSRSALSNYYSNLSLREQPYKAGLTGDWTTSLNYSDVHMWDEQHCVSIFFDPITLETLRSKNVTSVTLTLKVSGTLLQVVDGGDYRHQIRYKYNAETGEPGDASGNSWSSAADADSSAIGIGIAGRIGPESTTKQEVTDRTLTSQLSTDIPKYGYVIGPDGFTAAAANGLITISSTLTDTTLTVVTDETVTYPITYRPGQYASGDTYTDTKIEGTTKQLRGETYTREGHTQTGWSTTDGGAKAYGLGANYTANASITLYPYWEAETFEVTYNANGGSQAPSEQTKIYGTPLTLSTVIPIRDNYTFVGWSTTADGSPQYQPGGTYTANQPTTLYAIWSEDGTTAHASTLYVKANGLMIRTNVRGVDV